MRQDVYVLTQGDVEGNQLLDVRGTRGRRRSQEREQETDRGRA